MLRLGLVFILSLINFETKSSIPGDECSFKKNALHSEVRLLNDYLSLQENKEDLLKSTREKLIAEQKQLHKIKVTLNQAQYESISSCGLLGAYRDSGCQRAQIDLKLSRVAFNKSLTKIEALNQEVIILENINDYVENQQAQVMKLQVTPDNCLTVH